MPNGRAQYITPSPSETELSAKVSALKNRAHELVRREKARTEKKTNVLPNGVMRNGIYSINGGLGANAVTQINANSNDNRVVLTLYGSAPGPKQLFSSLQMLVKVDGEDVIQPLREAGLPNGITTTQIVPIQTTGLIDDRKRTQTLGEVFPSPANLLPLQPPKPSKIATTRSTTVGWYQPSAAAAETRPKTGSYFNQSVSTGQWLDYTNAAPPSPKRKRDRALSAVGARPLTSELDTAESEASKLDALFRSAYSGFAPTKDDAAAVVPERLVSRIWWQRVGEKNFERLVETSPDLEATATDPAENLSTMAEDVNEMENFKQAVEQWEDESVDPSLVPLGVEPQFEKSAEEKDVDEILEGISELLETLNSYQRIRHLQLNPSRSAGLLSTSETSSGTPAKPSDSELATYETLKSQLSMMIATLPPYAVARLDSDRLGELNISTKMEIQVDDYKGVMEEDEASARAKAANMSAGVGSATTSRTTPSLNHRPSNSALYGNQFPSSSRPVASGSTPYSGATQTPARQSSSNSWPRPPSTAPVPYPTQRPGSSAPYRPGGYTGTPTYPHQTPRPQTQYQQYAASAQSHNTPAAQRYNTATTPAYGRPTSQPYGNGSMPQTAPQQRYGQNPGGAYSQQGQSTQNGLDYRYANGMSGRQPSPQKPYSPQSSLAQPQARPSYGTPTPPVAHARPYLQASNPMMNGASSMPSAPQAQQQQYQRTVSSPYASSVMTTEQQASMMERQRAQLHQQQEIQEQARIAAQASAQLAGGQSASPKVTVAAGGL